MSHAGIADFRSDTVTRPTPAMREAMLTAPLGDDVFGDDPTVNELEAYAAGLFGKDAAVFVPSGTMANQIAVRVHAGPGDDALVESTSHVFLWEQGGMAQLSGVHARPLAGRRGVVAPEDIVAAIHPDDPHCTVTRLLVLENTHASSGGAVVPLDAMRAASTAARERGLAVHVDGARICNASAASGTSLSDFAACADSISCCLSKGLGAPVGSVLAGDAAFVHAARRARKVFGGAMRQAGIIAAAGLVALRDHRERLVEDHRRAAVLAEGLARHAVLDVVPAETNMVWARWPGKAEWFVAALGERGVLATAMDRDTVRLLTHLDVDDADVERAIGAAAAVVGTA